MMLETLAPPLSRTEKQPATTRRIEEIHSLSEAAPITDQDTFHVRHLTPSDRELWHQYGCLRARIFIDQRGILPKDARNGRGEEFDEDDARAQHIAVIVNGTIVGAFRFIERGWYRPLPVERFFGMEAEQPSFELSRLMVRTEHLGAPIQKLVMLSLLRALIHQANRRQAPVYGALDRSWLWQLKNIGLQPRELPELAHLSSRGTLNLAVRFDLSRAIEEIGEADSRIRDGLERYAPFVRQRAPEGGIGSAMLSDLSPDRRRMSANRELLSEAEQTRLTDSCVAIVGAGGSGGHLALALAQLGVGKFRLADRDVIAAESVSRLALANDWTIGRNKAAVLAEEIYKINPWAEIECCEEGVTAENIESFTEGAHLILAEAEEVQLKLGIMLARAARHRDIPMLLSLHAGYGTRVTSFHPRKGITYEGWLGICPHAPIPETVKTNVPLSSLMGDIPPYFNSWTTRNIAAGQWTLPTMSPGVLIAAGVAATQAQELLLADVTPARERNVVYAPHVIALDASHKLRIVRSKSNVRHYVSAIVSFFRSRSLFTPARKLAEQRGDC